jgi:hypothetical protein
MIDQILSKKCLREGHCETGGLRSPFPVVKTKLVQITDVACLAWAVLATRYVCLVNMCAEMCIFHFSLLEIVLSSSSICIRTMTKLEYAIHRGMIHAPVLLRD